MSRKQLKDVRFSHTPHGRRSLGAGSATLLYIRATGDSISNLCDYSVYPKQVYQSTDYPDAVNFYDVTTGSHGKYQMQEALNSFNNSYELALAKPLIFTGNYYAAQQQPILNLQKGQKYIFRTGNASLSSHPFKLSTASDGTHGVGTEYTSGVTNWADSFPERHSGALIWDIPLSAPDTMYYYCGNHAGMGGQINLTTPNGLSFSEDSPSQPKSIAFNEDSSLIIKTEGYPHSTEISNTLIKGRWGFGMWAKLDPTTGSDGVGFSTANGVSGWNGDQCLFDLGLYTGMFTNSGTKFVVSGVTGECVGNNKVLESNTGFNPTGWNHFALGKAGADLTLFINGEKQDSITPSTSAPSTLGPSNGVFSLDVTGSFYSIGSIRNQRNFLKGKVDDVILYGMSYYNRDGFIPEKSFSTGIFPKREHSAYKLGLAADLNRNFEVYSETGSLRTPVESSIVTRGNYENTNQYIVPASGDDVVLSFYTEQDFLDPEVRPFIEFHHDTGDGVRNIIANNIDNRYIQTPFPDMSLYTPSEFKYEVRSRLEEYTGGYNSTVSQYKNFDPQAKYYTSGDLQRNGYHLIVKNASWHDVGTYYVSARSNGREWYGSKSVTIAKLSKCDRPPITGVTPHNFVKTVISGYSDGKWWNDDSQAGFCTSNKCVEKFTALSWLTGLPGLDSGSMAGGYSSSNSVADSGCLTVRIASENGHTCGVDSAQNFYAEVPYNTLTGRYEALPTGLTGYLGMTSGYSLNPELSGKLLPYCEGEEWPSLCVSVVDKCAIHEQKCKNEINHCKSLNCSKNPIVTTPTPTLTSTFTNTPTPTPTISYTETSTQTHTLTPTNTTQTSTLTSTFTLTSLNQTPTPTQTQTPLPSTLTATQTPTVSQTNTATSTPTPTTTIGATPTSTSTAKATPTATPTPTPTTTIGTTPTPTPYSSSTPTPTPKVTPTSTLTLTPTSVAGTTPTATPTPNVTPTGTPTLTATSITLVGSSTPTPTPQPTPTSTTTPTPTPTVVGTTLLTTYTPVVTTRITTTPAPTSTTQLGSTTLTLTPVPTSTSFTSPSFVLTSVYTASPTTTPTSTQTPTPTPKPTATNTPIASPSFSPTPVLSPTTDPCGDRIVWTSNNPQFAVYNGTYYKAGSYGGKPYFRAEYIERGTLHDAVRTRNMYWETSKWCIGEPDGGNSGCECELNVDSDCPFGTFTCGTTQNPCDAVAPPSIIKSSHNSAQAPGNSIIAAGTEVLFESQLRDATAGGWHFVGEQGNYFVPAKWWSTKIEGSYDLVENHSLNLCGTSKTLCFEIWGENDCHPWQKLGQTQCFTIEPQQGKCPEVIDTEPASRNITVKRGESWSFHVNVDESYSEVYYQWCTPEKGKESGETYPNEREKCTSETHNEIDKERDNIKAGTAGTPTSLTPRTDVFYANGRYQVMRMVSPPALPGATRKIQTTTQKPTPTTVSAASMEVRAAAPVSAARMNLGGGPRGTLVSVTGGTIGYAGHTPTPIIRPTVNNCIQDNPYPGEPYNNTYWGYNAHPDDGGTYTVTIRSNKNCSNNQGFGYSRTNTLNGEEYYPDKSSVETIDGDTVIQPEFDCEETITFNLTVEDTLTPERANCHDLDDVRLSYESHACNYFDTYSAEFFLVDSEGNETYIPYLHSYVMADCIGPNCQNMGEYIIFDLDLKAAMRDNYTAGWDEYGNEACPLCPTHIKARLPIYVDEYNCRDNQDGYYCDKVIERTYYPAGGGTASHTNNFSNEHEKVPELTCAGDSLYQFSIEWPQQADNPTPRMCNSGVYNQTAKYDPFNNANSGWSCLSNGLSGTDITPFCCDVNLIWESGAGSYGFNSYNQESALMITPRDSGKYTFTSQRPNGYTGYIDLTAYVQTKTGIYRYLKIDHENPRYSLAEQSFYGTNPPVIGSHSKIHDSLPAITGKTISKTIKKQTRGFGRSNLVNKKSTAVSIELKPNEEGYYATGTTTYPVYENNVLLGNSTIKDNMINIRTDASMGYATTNEYYKIIDLGSVLNGLPYMDNLTGGANGQTHRGLICDNETGTTDKIYFWINQVKNPSGNAGYPLRWDYEGWPNNESYSSPGEDVGWGMATNIYSWTVGTSRTTLLTRTDGSGNVQYTPTATTVATQTATPISGTTIVYNLSSTQTASAAAQYTPTSTPEEKFTISGIQYLTTHSPTPTPTLTPSGQLTTTATTNYTLQPTLISGFTSTFTTKMTSTPDIVSTSTTAWDKRQGQDEVEPYLASGGSFTTYCSGACNEYDGYTDGYYSNSFTTYREFTGWANTGVCPGTCSGVEGGEAFPYNDSWSDTEIWSDMTSTHSCLSNSSVIGASTWTIFGICPTGTRLFGKINVPHSGQSGWVHGHLLEVDARVFTTGSGAATWENFDCITPTGVAQHPVAKLYIDGQLVES